MQPTSPFVRRLSHLLAAFLLVLPLSTPVEGKGFGRSSGGSRGSSYSSGSRSSYSSSPSPTPSRPSSPSPSFNSPAPSSRPSYTAPSVSNGGNSPGRSSYSSPSNAGITPGSASGYDSSAARARQVQQSTQNYSAAKAQTPPPLPPANTNSANTPSGAGYTNRPSGNYPGTPGGSYSNVPPPRTSYSNRSSGWSGSVGYHSSYRHYSSFNPYYALPAIVFADAFSSVFWYWLLDQPKEVRTQWIHHHGNAADPQRIAALYQKDPSLKAEVDKLVATNAAKDPNYTPPGLEKEAMTAPPPPPADASPSVPSSPATPPVQNVVRSSTATKGSSIFPFLAFLGISGGLVWLLFFKRWKKPQH